MTIDSIFTISEDDVKIWRQLSGDTDAYNANHKSLRREFFVYNVFRTKIMEVSYQVLFILIIILYYLVRSNYQMYNCAQIKYVSSIFLGIVSLVIEIFIL